MSDETCLEIAALLRDDFDYVFSNLRDAIEQAKAYAVRMTRRT